MNQKDIVSQHIGSLLCRSDISVTDMLGIQSQSLRYSKWVAKVRGIDMDAEPERYFRAWTLRGTMHIHEVSDYNLYMHPQNAGTTTTGLLHKQRGCIYSKSQDEYYAGKEARHGKIVYA